MSTPRTPGSGAFTLLETLVVVAIATILVSLVAVTLTGARRRAADAATLARLRTHAQIFGVYQADYRDLYPYFTLPGFASTPLTLDDNNAIDVSYFDAFQSWNVALADAYYDRPWSDPVFYPPGYLDDVGASVFTPFAYPCSFLADPRYWDPESRTGPDQWRATAAHEVVFPSEKTLIVSTWPLIGRVAQAADQRDIGVPAALADASARFFGPDERAPGYDRGDGFQFATEGAVHFNDFPPLLHTSHGVAGSDHR